MSLPTANSSSTSALPVWAMPVIRSRPCSPFSASSWRVTISRSTSAGAAPGQSVSTVITGWRTSGASCTGIALSATRPNITTISTAAITAIGRSIARRIGFIALTTRRGGRPPSPAAVSASRRFSMVIGWPGRSRSLPRTTVRSPAASPSTTSNRLPTSTPSCTGRTAASPSL